MVPQLVHVWVVLSHDGDGVTLLADDETSLLLRSIPQVNTVVLIKKKKKRMVRGRFLKDTCTVYSVV